MALFPLASIELLSSVRLFTASSHSSLLPPYRSFSSLSLLAMTPSTPTRTLPRNLHSYDDAIAKLNSLQSNASIIDQLRKSRGSLNHRSLPEMRVFLARLGYSVRSPTGFNSFFRD